MHNSFLKNFLVIGIPYYPLIKKQIKTNHKKGVCIYKNKFGPIIF